ncbi:hypothetical protein KIN20_003187 [Parelaphostrongylus tenuis]|uniref:Uncharacterized protein n=1 Tax=Parelaphostrongylus tenuis TaxID=148309 RepID=A0AAD5QE45_PARTN|nr:hypothetical protein KIN20_003187 [Parelaphostrongylus tenuis]
MEEIDVTVVTAFGDVRFLEHEEENLFVLHKHRFPDLIGSHFSTGVVETGQHSLPLADTCCYDNDSFSKAK